MPRSPSAAYARPSPGASIKSPELNAPRTSQIQGMVNLNGDCSKGVHASVGTRIYAAIAVTAVLTVGATAVAFWSFAQVGQTMRELVEDRFPVVEISFDLADAAAASVAIVPRLADAATLKILDEQMGLLISAEQRMRQQVGTLPTTAAGDKAHMVAEIDRLSRDLTEAYQPALDRLILIADRRQRTADLASAQEQLTQLFVSI